MSTIAQLAVSLAVAAYRLTMYEPINNSVKVLEEIVGSVTGCGD